MTGSSGARQRKTGNIFLRGSMTVSLLFILFLLLRNTELAVSFVRDGLSLCANVIIPSLFPFMVLSELLLACEIDRGAARLFDRPMRQLFGISGMAGSALVFGALCGFPVGARMAASLYDRGEIDRDTLSYLLTFCNNASPAFLIGTVGTVLWSSKKVGILLCLIQLLCAVFIGMIGARKHFRTGSACSGTRKIYSDGGAAFPQAFSHAANGMLVVCAYVIFFSSVIGALKIILEHLPGTSLLTALLFGIFELSSGMNAAACLADPHLGFILSALFVGWSGLSVHGQILAMTADRGISRRPYFAAKALHGVLCALCAAILCLIFPSVIPAPSTSVSLNYRILPSPYLDAVNFSFLFVLLLRGCGGLKKKIFSKNHLRL